MNAAYRGGLSNRPTRFVGGTRRQNESPEEFRARMDAGRAPAAPMPMATRTDRIVAARMDGTFDAKRDAFNQSNAAKGLYMDEAGNIGPKPEPTPAPAAPAPAAVKPAGAPVLKPAAPMLTAKNRPEPLFDGQPKSKSPIFNPAPAAPPLRAGVPASPKPGTINVTAAMKAPPSAPAAPKPVTPPVQVGQGTAAMKLAAFNAKNPNVMTKEQTDAIAAQKRAFVNNLATASTQMKPAVPAPAPAPVAAPQPIAGAGFTGPAGVAAAKQAVALKRSEQDAADLARYKAEDAANPPRNEVAMPSGRPYPFSASGHGNKPVPKAAPMPQVPRIAMRADGGPVEAGKPYLVGERGPEIVVPKQSGTVIPNHALPKKPPRGSSLVLAALAAPKPHAAHQIASGAVSGAMASGKAAAAGKKAAPAPMKFALKPPMGIIGGRV